MRSYWENLATDLLRLEVNTIISDELTCDKPLIFRRLLFDLAKDYRLKIGEYTTWLENKKAPTINEEVEGFKYYFGGYKSFEEIWYQAEPLKVRLHDLIIMSQDEEYCKKLRSRLVMVDRIQKQSSMIMKVMDALKTRHSTEEEWNNDYSEDEVELMRDLQFAPDQMSIIRKAYEIGTQQILLQTVVQIEGDITSYITHRFLKHPVEEQKMLLQLHNTALETSLRMWQYLFNIVGSFAGGAVGGLFPDKKLKK